MEIEKSNQAMPFHEPSMEQNISFVTALQELKNLRPHLYSAAEYCEKSYLHSEQKQVVLDNLKDYLVRALVNAVDHIGTVAYKLTDLLDQQTSEISTTGLHVTCLHQQFLTCQTYTDREALRQQQLLAVVPRHHKHYSLPNSVSKKVHFSPHIRTDPKQSQFQPRPRQFTSGTPAANTLCWHLASETKSTLGGSRSMSVTDPKSSRQASLSSHESNGDDMKRTKSSEADVKLHKLGPASSTAIQTLGISRQDSMVDPRTVMSFRSFDNPSHNEIPRAPIRSKSVLSTFFVRQKTPKLRTSAVS